MAKNKKRPSKSDPRSDANFPLMNVAGWFVPEIAKSKELIIATTTPLVDYVGRRVRCNSFNDFDDYPQPVSVPMSDAIKKFACQEAKRWYSVVGASLGITLATPSENAGAKSPAMVDMIFEVPFLERLARGKFRTIPYVKQVFEAFDADGNCFFALANADVGYENRWGTLYSIFPKQRMSCQKHIDYFRWYDILNGPQDQVRGVYWGTFIGSKLAKKLPRSIVDDFNALSDPYAGSPQHAAWLPNGSVYFLLNDDPRVNYDEEIEPPTGLDNMYTNCGVWLARQLHKAGIF